jgi:hypothetical protein
LENKEEEESRHHFRDFNYILVAAFDEMITDVLGSEVLTALNATLLKDYDVSRDELPYRFDTAVVVLTDVLGVRNARTIFRGVIRKLYRKVGLDFDENTDYQWSTHLETAKQKLADQPH